MVIRVAMAIAGGHEQTESNPPERKWFYGELDGTVDGKRQPDAYS